MVVKNISIMEDTYNLLIARKKANESFSDLIRRTFKKKRDISEFIGAWEDMSENDAEEMKENIKKIRKRSGEDTIKKIKRMHEDLH